MHGQNICNALQCDGHLEAGVDRRVDGFCCECVRATFWAQRRGGDGGVEVRRNTTLTKMVSFSTLNFV